MSDKAQLNKVQILLRAALGHKPKAVDQNTSVDETTSSEKGNAGAEKGKFVLQDTDFDPSDFFDDSWMDKDAKDKKNEEDEEEAKEGAKNEEGERQLVVVEIDKGEGEGEGEKTEKEEKEGEGKESEEISRDEVQVSTVDAFQGAEKGIHFIFFLKPLPLLLLCFSLFRNFILPPPPPPFF